MDMTIQQDAKTNQAAPLPEKLLAILHQRRIGISGQRILDLGIAPSNLGHKLSQAGCQLIVESDIIPTDPTHPPAPYDIICADQCWQYYQTEEKLRRLYDQLHPTGHLVISQRDNLALYGNVVQATQNLLGD